MKKIFAFVLTSVLALGFCFGAVGCQKTEKVVLGFDAEFPPYGYEENGEYVGFDIEYAKKVCANLGLELELKPIDWDAKDADLESGAIDFIWNGFTYEGREDGYEWTERYLNNSIVVLTNVQSIDSLSDLAGKDVAVQSDSSGEEALSEKEDLVASFNGGKFCTEKDYNTACQKLVAGSYQAIVVDYGVAKYLQGKNSALKIVSEAVATETYGVGFKKGNTELCKKINDEMKKVGKDEAFIKGLCEKYGVEYEAFLLK